MSVESEARSILLDMGMWWPDADSAALREAATAWRTFATAVDGVRTPTGRTAASLIHNNRGQAIEAFSTFWSQYAMGQDGGWLDDLATAARSMASGLEKYAKAVDRAVDRLWTEIGISAAVIVAGVGLTFFTAGISDGAAAVAAEGIIELSAELGVEVSETVATIAATTLTGAAFGSVESMTLDAAVTQPLRIATGLQQHFSLSEVDSSAKSGMLWGGGLGLGGGILAAGVSGELSGLFNGVPKDLRPPVLRPNLIDEGSAGRPKDSVTRCNDPVDVATGEMLMPQTDLDLPGALPLVFERTHFSSGSAGSAFGRTWMSTLDEAVQLDVNGVVFASADGVRLAYPVPRPDEAVLPSKGARWPLVWDGRRDGVFTITDTDTGIVRTFSGSVPVGSPGVVHVPVDSWHDRNGHRIDVERDHRGVPTGLRHSGGYFVAIDTLGPRVTALRLLETPPSRYEPYDPTTHADAGTVIVRYGYDADGRLTDVVNSSDLSLRFTYDDDERITSWTDRNGTHFSYVYDTAGRVLRTEGTDGVMAGGFAYDDADRITTYTDSLGHRTRYRHDADGLVIEETDPLGNVTRTTWDPVTQQRLTSTDPLHRTTAYTYDDAGRLSGVTLPDGSTSQVTYGEVGLPVRMVDPTGAVWHNAYDERGNLLTATDPLGGISRYAYDDAGHPVSVTDALGDVRQLTCNAAGLPMAVTDGLGHPTTVVRDAFGRVVEAADPLGRVTRLGWTVEGKPSWRETPDGARESWSWDGEGNLLTHTDQAGNVTTYTTGTFDLPTTRTDPDGTSYTFTHDTELRVTAVTNPHGLRWSYTYDPAGRLISETDFNGRNLTYTHDATGALTSRTNGAGETVRLKRDLLGRIVEQRYEDGALTSFGYDAAGQLVEASNSDAQVGIERDALGRPLAETVNGLTLRSTYDLLGRLVSRTTPSGLMSRWTWDSAGRPVGLANDTGTIAFAYDAADRETGRRLGDGATLTQEWDAADRLATQIVTSAHRLLQHRAYAYRPDGCLTEIRELTAGTRRFDLNPTGRVTAVHAHGWSEVYAYDTAGNLTHATAPDHPSPGERKFTGTLIQHAGRTRFEHDRQGRLTRKTVSLLNGQKHEWNYTWNAEDRLTRVAMSSGEQWHYAYDPLGRRVAKWRVTDDGGQADRVDFTWDGTRTAEQTSTDGTTITWDHLPGTHRPVAQTTHHPATPGNSTLFARLSGPARPAPRFHAVITDAAGTPTELLTPDGSLAWQARTALWGTPLPAASPDATDCPLRFPGQYADAETGLHYNYFRYYDPETARYASADPLGLEPADNHHGYVGNPFLVVDVLGLTPCDSRATWELTKDGASRILKGGPFKTTFYKSSSDATWWTPDITGHGESAFKVFRETSKGLEWISDADKYGDYMPDKWKGDTGKFIPWKNLRGAK